MTYDQFKPLHDRANADNLLAYCLAHASQPLLVKLLQTPVRVANDQTDVPQYIPLAMLTAGHVRLY